MTHKGRATGPLTPPQIYPILIRLLARSSQAESADLVPSLDSHLGQDGLADRALQSAEVFRVTEHAAPVSYPVDLGQLWPTSFVPRSPLPTLDQATIPANGAMPGDVARPRLESRLALMMFVFSSHGPVSL